MKDPALISPEARLCWKRRGEASALPPVTGKEEFLLHNRGAACLSESRSKPAAHLGEIAPPSGA